MLPWFICSNRHFYHIRYAPILLDIVMAKPEKKTNDSKITNDI